MTFYNIDGTPYGPVEYAADKTVIYQSKITGSRAPYEVERRVADYERGDNPFDSKYNSKKSDYKSKNSAIDFLDTFDYVFNLILGIIFVLSPFICFFKTIGETDPIKSTFWGSIFPFIIPVFWFLRWIITKL